MKHQIAKLLAEQWNPRRAGKLDIKVGNSSIKAGGGTVYISSKGLICKDIPLPVIAEIIKAGYRVRSSMRCGDGELPRLF